MKNLQKDSSGSQLLEQFSCQAVTATARVSNRLLARAFCKVYGSDSLTARTDDNFVAPNVSQSASLFYKRAIGVRLQFLLPAATAAQGPMATAPSSPAAGRAPARTRACCA